MRARILLVDDHQMMRDGLRMMIRQEPDLEVVGEAGNGQNALMRARELRPDVIIMDVQLGDMDGIEVSRLLMDEIPQVKVIIVSAYPDAAIVNRAVQAGIMGYLLKANALADLTRAIRVVLAGNPYLCPEVAKEVIHDYKKLISPLCRPARPVITAREREVLKLTAEGRRIKEIADQLKISVKTVETHRAHLLAKLDCSSVAELTRYAIREGISSL